MSEKPDPFDETLDTDTDTSLPVEAEGINPDDYDKVEDDHVDLPDDDPSVAGVG